MYNPSTSTQPIQIEFMLSSDVTTWKSIDVYGDVTDQIAMGRTHTYRLDARNSFFNELDSLQIELASLFGDTDL